MDMILKELEDYAGSSPILFGGDLNARPDAPMLKAVRLKGFRVEESNDTTGGTTQKVVDGRIVIGASYIDFLLVKGVPVIRDETSPKVILAAYPPRPDGTLLGDHAVVTAKVELPWL